MAKRYYHEDLLNRLSDKILQKEHTEFKVSFPDDAEAKAFFEKMKERMELFRRWADPHYPLSKTDSGLIKYFKNDD